VSSARAQVAEQFQVGIDRSADAAAVHAEDHAILSSSLRDRPQCRKVGHLDLEVVEAAGLGRQRRPVFLDPFAHLGRSPIGMFSGRLSGAAPVISDRF
jgi:hypothetical protein